MPKTIRLDAFRYITNEAWRALVSIEMGLKNHEVVPVELAQKISRCKRNGCGFIKLIKDQLIPNSLVAYETDSRKCMSGYRLTNLGYDYLALHQLFVSSQLANLGSMIGAGKESDVYLAVAGATCGVQKGDSSDPLVVPGSPVVVKFHRLGRTSFRKVKEKRDYHQHRNTCSWLYLDRLASQREFSMMKVLRSHGVAVPVPLAHNRNAVVMSYISDSLPLSRILPGILKASDSILARHLYIQAKQMLHAICAVGLVHGDYNEFNLMVVGLSEVDLERLNESDLTVVRLVLIDFPQMISREHPSADSLYQRDSNGIVSFFGRFFEIQNDDLPVSFKKIARTAHADVEVKAPGYTSTRRGHRRDVKDILLGSTIRQETSDETDELSSTSADEFERSSESASQNESVEEEEETELSEISPVNNMVSGSSSVLDSMAVLDKRMKMLKVSKIKSSGVIDLEDIRARRRRERRHQEQVLFQQNIKRNARANTKRQGRASLKAELTIFG
ncbi:hypothetical protein EG68_10936 [Paragonimus skrjabini miyazakii]|uniref:non-specific serine/threonine protein kinase n=1 Tax=Paragonimus skrjabini miyazakii TaxID=59628 RepID=A0A8S9YPY0_9TREM|nr:hypothetical protein EG68_10936 [Paragonimus skrjabini miyazakii]